MYRMISALFVDSNILILSDVNIVTGIASRSSLCLNHRLIA